MTRVVRPLRRAFVGGSIALLFVMASCASGDNAVAAKTDTVTRADVTAGVSAIGALAAVGTENLGFPASGKLTSVRVKVGDRVKAGQVLATVDDTAAKATLTQAKSNLRAQEAGLDRLTSATTVSGAQSTADQANTIVDATKSQVAATADADAAAISRAKSQLNTDEDAKDQAESALKAIKAACKAASSGAATSNAAIGSLAQQALAQIQAGDSAGAQATLDQLNAQLSSAGAGDSTACSQVLTAQAAVSAAKQKVEADKTALVSAQQKKKVDAAAGTLAVASAQQGAVAAQNGVNSSSADRPHSIEQQQALVDSAEAAVKSVQKTVSDTVLKATNDGTITVINGAKGEFVSPSTGTTAQAPGSAAAIPGSAAATSTTGTTRPGGTQFIVLSNVAKLQLVLPFEQSDAAQLKPNQKVDLQADAAPDSALTGHVVSVAPSGTASSGTISYYATVALDGTDNRLKDGQTARGTVHTVDKQGVLSVPNAAVHRDGDTTTVVLQAPDGSQQSAPFEAGVVGSDRTEVLSGLSEGQRVVLPSGAS